MSIVRPFFGTARVDDQHPDIFPGSPMALVAVFTHCLQARFSGSNVLDENSPYVWAPDAQPLNPQSGQTRIYIESQFTAEPDARDRKPALLVEKGITQPQQVIVGDRADIDRTTMTELFIAWANVPISVLCIANNRGTSATLADLVFMFFLGSKNHIRQIFSIHDLSAPTLSDTQPYRPSSSHVETWVTTVTMSAMIKFAWRTRPIAPLLKEIAAKMRFGNSEEQSLRAIDLKNAR
jgi:hypothetical protein